MATLFYEDFKDKSQWVNANGQISGLVVEKDPLSQQSMVGSFTSITGRPDTMSKILYNQYKSYTVSFDYLGLPRSQEVAINLGCTLSISDGGSLSDLTTFLAGSLKSNSALICGDGMNAPSNRNDKCDWYGTSKVFSRLSEIKFLVDNSGWYHYSYSFSTNNEAIRIGLSDHSYANYPEGGVPHDCYFANLIVTDSFGPSPFIAKQEVEEFRSITINVLNKVANAVSYENSNSGVKVFLSSRGYNGYAEGDTYVGITKAVGSSFNDELYGTSADNRLNGAAGDDIIESGQGNDVLIGGSGNDRFVIGNSISTTTIEDFNIQDDKIDLRNYQEFTSLPSVLSASAYNSGSTTINLGGSKSLILTGVNVNDLQAGDFMFFVPSSSPTPTPSITSSPSNTPSITPSNSVTPSNTPSPSITPSNTPTNTVTPTSTPSADPSITSSPTPTSSVTPSHTPSTTSSPSPSPFAVHTIKSGGIYMGTSGRDIFRIDSDDEVIILGKGGGDIFQFYLHKDVNITITDFKSNIDLIDLSKINTIHNIGDISFMKDPLAVKIPDNQLVTLADVRLSDIDETNFIFSSESPSSEGSAPDASNLVYTVILGVALYSLSDVI